MSTKIDARQSISRSYLSMIANKSAFNSNNYTEVDNLLIATNDELTPPFQMTPSDPVNRTLHVGSSRITNSETSVRHMSLPTNSDFSLFSNGTVVFPASDGGTITGTNFNGAPVINCPSGQYELIVIDYNPLLKLLEAVPGLPAASEATALIPTLNPSKIHIGIVVLHNTGGSIDNITGAMLVQFGGSGSGSGTFPFPIANNQVSPADITGFLVDPTANKAFKADYSIIRRAGGVATLSEMSEDTFFATNAESGFNSDVLGMDYQSDEKLLVVGLFSSYDGVSVGKITRLSKYGIVDSAWQTNVGTGIVGGNATNIRVDSNGKAVFIGSWSSFNGNSTLKSLVRLNTNGTLDSTFATNIGTAFPAGGALDFGFQSDGSLICVGPFTSFNGNSTNRIVKLNPDGTYNSTFTTNIGTGFNASPYAVKVNADDTILVVGIFTSFNGTTVNRIAKLNADGTLNSTFTTNIGTAADSDIYSVNVDSFGNVFASGVFANFNGTAAGGIVKLSALGVFNGTFNTNIGTGMTAGSQAILVDENDGIYFGGFFTTFNGNTRNRIIRLNNDGTEESTFITTAGTGFDNTVYAMAHNSISNDVSMGGFFANFNGNPRGHIVRFNLLVDLTPIAEDTGFATAIGTGSGGANTPAMDHQADGKMLLGGQFTAFNGTSVNRIVRLNTDYTVDTAFVTNIGTGVPTGQVNWIKVQTDQKILAVGSFTSFNGNTRNRIFRLNANGTEDSTFATNIGTAANGNITFVDVLSDGSIIIGGPFTSFNGNSINRLAKLNSDGTFNSTFATNIGTGFGASPVNIAIKADDSMIVVGSFTSFNSSTHNRIVKLSSNGTEDTAFSTAVGTGGSASIDAIGLDAAENIYLGGQFTAFAGNSINRLAKLDPLGNFDGVFQGNVGSGFNIGVENLKVDAYNKVYFVGDFTTFNGNSRVRAVKLASDGTEDADFPTALGTGFNAQVFQLDFNPLNGDITMSGSFTTFNGNSRSQVVQFNQPVIPPTPPITGTELKEVGSFSGVYSDNNTDWTIIGETFSGDDAGVVFTMTSAGQLQYTSSNLTGTIIESEAKFSLTKL